MSTHCFLVDLEILKRNESELKPVYIDYQAPEVTRDKTHAVSTRQQVNARRRKPHLDDLARLRQIFSSYAQTAKTELTLCSQYPIRIVCRRSDP